MGLLSGGGLALAALADAVAAMHGLHVEPHRGAAAGSGVGG